MTSDLHQGTANLAAFFPPSPDPDSAPFWAGLRDRRLVLQRCASCQTLRWPFRSVCARCLGRGWTEQTLSGEGTIYSWTVIHHATVPTPPALLPYCVVLVALAEDPSILIPAQYDGSRDELQAGLPVAATFHDASQDVTVLHWRRRAVPGAEPTGTTG